MKKNLNVIQIKGLRGLAMVGLLACCLFAGFVVFPGMVAMYAWNFLASYFVQIPVIGLLQGVLLWGILVAAYFAFRKEKLIVCMKSSEGLTEEELKAVFADVKRQAQDDKIVQAMLKAREAELKIKSVEDTSINKEEENSTKL